MYLPSGLAFFSGAWILRSEVYGESMEIGVAHVLNFPIVLEFSLEVLGIVTLSDFASSVLLRAFACLDLSFTSELREFIPDLDSVEHGFGFPSLDAGEHLSLSSMAYLQVNLMELYFY